MPIDFAWEIKDKFTGKLKRLTLRKYKRKMRKTMKKASLILARQVMQNVNGPILHVRTNRLRASWGPRESILVTERGRDYIASIGSNVVYSRIHEFGGMAGPGRRVPIPSRKYVSRSVKQVENKMSEKFVEAIDELIKEL